MAQATVKMYLKMKTVHADGSDCACCGDKIFLKGYQLGAYCGQKAMFYMKQLFCCSCGEMIKQEIASD